MMILISNVVFDDCCSMSVRHWTCLSFLPCVLHWGLDISTPLDLDFVTCARH